jgi:hypothetical protein
MEIVNNEPGVKGVDTKHVPPFTELPRDIKQTREMEADPDSVQKKLNALRKGDLDEGFMEKRRQAIEARPQLSNDIPEEPKRLSLGGKVMKFVRKYLYW